MLDAQTEQTAIKLLLLLLLFAKSGTQVISLHEPSGDSAIDYFECTVQQVATTTFS